MGTTRLRALHGFAILTAVSTFVLIFAGGLVTSTGSGLAVPDWPLSYGMLFPPMVGGILYEHGHRLIAGAVGLLMTGLMIWIVKTEDRRWVRWLAVGAWSAVVVQALLGGLTVRLLLPTVVSVSHAGVAELFFALVVALAVVTSPLWRSMTAEQTRSRSLFRLSLAAVLVIYGQILLGAWVRHSGAGLAIPDFPLAYGRLIPPLSSSALADVNHALIFDWDLPRIARIGQVAVHFAHRVGALIVSLVVIALFVETLRRARHERLFVALAAELLILLLVQVTLGALTIWTRKAVFLTTAHLAVGALMFVSSVVYLLLYRHRFVPAREARAPVEAANPGARATKRRAHA